MAYDEPTGPVPQHDPTFRDQPEPLWTPDQPKDRSPAGLPLEEKTAMVRLIMELRATQLIGLLESRRWIEALFPEFADIRDRELDALYEQVAQEMHGTEFGGAGS